MQTGKCVRIEELTRMSADVQDTLITVLSEKMLPVPELDIQYQAVRGFNVIATANNRDKGVNELSSALKRRFNTVILPTPKTAAEEIDIVKTRVSSLAKNLELPVQIPAVTEIARIVKIFRELRHGVTEDGKMKVKSPTGTMSTAEVISVVNSGLALAAHFGSGELKANDIASVLVGAIVKDPIQDDVIWKEYLETVVKTREEYRDIYRACKEQ
jgi:MoxR-like ATPase